MKKRLLALMTVSYTHLDVYKRQVHQGELLILEFLSDIFLYGFRVFPDKFDVQHCFSPTFFI